MRKLWVSLVAVILLAGCRCGPDAPGSPDAAPTGTATAAAAPAVPPPRTRVGSTIAVSDDGGALLVAEEDRNALWSVAMPVGRDSKATRHDMPGRPAQVLPLRDRILVTLRDPGALLVLDRELGEKGRVALPADAWGVAVTADAKTALVTSAWTHQVTAVDLEALKVRWTADVPREPRAVVIPRDGDRAYVTHLVGTAVTRIDRLGSEAPGVTSVALPAAPSRASAATEVGASLGYAALLSPDEDRLFVARHALGAAGGSQTWFGAATVDVLLTDGDKPFAPMRERPYPPTRLSDTVKPKKTPENEHMVVYGPTHDIDGPLGALPLVPPNVFVQPRAMAYRAATDTLLVASEGGDEIVELDAQFLEPALLRLKRYRVGAGYGKAIVVAERGGAPSGIALSPDGATAFVFCRTTSDVAVVPLVALADQTHPDDTVYVRLADEDPLLEGVAKTDPKRSYREAAVVGRKLFYNALDEEVSGGMACAGCHPDGRDDGHVWLEVEVSHSQDTAFEHTIFLGGPALLRYHAAKIETVFSTKNAISTPRARQTPMLAGRVRAKGAFGWRAENDTLIARVDAGFHLHRWFGKFGEDLGAGGPGGAIAAYLLTGLQAPPRSKEPLTEEQERGKAIFHSQAAGCTTCHLSEDAFSNWSAVKVRVPHGRAGFADETGLAFKTPSLHFVGGTAPYYHDGSMATLADLVAGIGVNMGKTAHLGSAEQQALVAYLETI